MDTDLDTWQALRQEAITIAACEPLLARRVKAMIIDHATLGDALAHLLADRLATTDVPLAELRELLRRVLRAAPTLNTVRLDLTAIVARDPAADGLVNPFLNHKGFHALEAYRVAHSLWNEPRHAIAHFVQSRANEVFAVDIHPAAKIGVGVFIDHGTGVVIGETSVVEDNVSILQGVTLGGTGKQSGVRHPQVGAGVLIGAGAQILGYLRIGAGAKIGAGSVVLKDVPPHTTVVGVPARIVGAPAVAQPGLDMDHRIEHETTGSAPKSSLARLRDKLKAQ